MKSDPLPLAVTLIPGLVRERDADEFWVTDNGVRTWRDFGAALDEAHRQCAVHDVRPGAVVLIPADDGFEALVWLFAVAAVGGVAAPLRRARLPEIAGWADFLEIAWRVEAGRLERVGTGRFSPGGRDLLEELQRRGHAGLVLATGGTTGTPKLVLHDLRALLATVPVRGGQGWRTLPLMRFDHIGGLDAAWRAVAAGQVLVAPPAEPTPVAVLACLARHRVEVMPATPSFLNLLLLAAPEQLAELRSLRIVPYGAEPMPAALLARLRAALPAVDFTQRFGTSETGALPVRAQGPGLALGADAGGFAWKVVEDELWIRSPARALGYLSGGPGGLTADGWFRTGDIAVQLADGTVQVVGRRSEFINVGGEKVLPATVESLLLGHPLVADCRAYAVPNAFLGQVVGAEVVWRGPERDPVAIKRHLHAFASASPKCHLPAVVRVVKSVDTTGNLKKLRLSTA